MIESFMDGLVYFAHPGGLEDLARAAGIATALAALFLAVYAGLWGCWLAAMSWRETRRQRAGWAAHIERIRRGDALEL